MLFTELQGKEDGLKLTGWVFKTESEAKSAFKVLSKTAIQQTNNILQTSTTEQIIFLTTSGDSTFKHRVDYSSIIFMRNTITNWYLGLAKSKTFHKQGKIFSHTGEVLHEW